MAAFAVAAKVCVGRITSPPSTFIIVYAMCRAPVQELVATACLAPIDSRKRVSSSAVRGPAAMIGGSP